MARNVCNYDNRLFTLRNDVCIIIIHVLIIMNYDNRLFTLRNYLQSPDLNWFWNQDQVNPVIGQIVAYYNDKLYI